MGRITILLIVVFFIMGCYNNESQREGLKTSNVSMVVMEDEAIGFDENIAPPRSMEPPAPMKKHQGEVALKDVTKIIKEGAITMEVDSLSMSKAAIDSIVTSYGAYYENETFNGGNRNFRYTLKIRIPNINFEGFIASLESGHGTITNKNINAKDVTSEYVDLQIRLDNNKAYLEQYRELLKRAKSMKDILEIQEKSRKIETEIDAQLGRMKYINDQVKYSTLTLNVYQKYIKRNNTSTPSFLSRIGESISFGFSGMVDFIIMIVALWPLIIISGLFFLLFKKYRRRKKQIKA